MKVVSVKQKIEKDENRPKKLAVRDVVESPYRRRKKGTNSKGTWRTGKVDI